mmetsp:Transcript_6472/g.888  ORF Transcript_6472/g.888 Transcript_6472/m.888 type:complete len:91 (+) Transcript_6472:252-524(+)
MILLITEIINNNSIMIISLNLNLNLNLSLLIIIIIVNLLLSSFSNPLHLSILVTRTSNSNKVPLKEITTPLLTTHLLLPNIFEPSTLSYI